jgi:hypothetical protein
MLSGFMEKKQRTFEPSTQSNKNENEYSGKMLMYVCLNMCGALFVTSKI